MLAFTAWANTWGFSMAFVGLRVPDRRLPGRAPSGRPVAPAQHGLVVVSAAISLVIAISPTLAPAPDGSTTRHHPEPVRAGT